MAELKNEFSWSWSRHRAFSSCQRRYWLQHYGFWGGWDPSSPAREIYIQKRLNTRPQWMGTMVHQAAEWVLGEVQRKHYPEPERVVERFRRQAQRMVDDSRLGRYRIKPKHAPGFVEHYYDQDPGPEAWSESVDEIARQVQGLFTDPVFQRLTSVPERIVEVERLEQVIVGDVPVWVSLDVLVGDGSGGLVVIDWKTGRFHDSETVARQLGVYGVYVLDRYFDVPALSAATGPVDKVKAMYVNLRDGHRETRDLDVATVEATVSTILTSAAAMRERLANVPENIANKEDFPMVPEGDPLCAACNYRRTCGRN